MICLFLFFLKPTNGKFSSEVTLISTQRLLWQDLSKIVQVYLWEGQKLSHGQKYSGLQKTFEIEGLAAPLLLSWSKDGKLPDPREVG